MVVKPLAGDRGYRPGHHRAVDLREKLELLAERAGGQRELARRAKLKDERHVGVIISRLRKNPSADIERETLNAIAAGGGVSVEWLSLGTGTPDSADADAPLHTDDVEPIAENIPNYLAVEQLDRAAHPDIEEPHWLTARGVAHLVVNTAAVPGDAYKLAKLAREFADPERVARVFAAQAERIKAMEAEREAERLRYERDLAALRAQRAVGGKPKGGRKAGT